MAGSVVVDPVADAVHVNEVRVGVGSEVALPPQRGRLAIRVERAGFVPWTGEARRSDHVLVTLEPAGDLSWRALGDVVLPEQVAVSVDGLRACLMTGVGGGETRIHFDHTGAARGVQIVGKQPPDTTTCLRRRAAAARIGPLPRGRAAIARFVHATGAVEALSPQPPLSLAVQMGSSGLRVTGSDAKLGLPSDLPCLTEGCVYTGTDVGEAYDAAALTALLTRAKRLHPSEYNVILLFEPETRYEAVVWLMDRTRGEECAPERGLTDCLFPSPVIAGGAP